MKDNPLISIITVTYNAELTIERTLQSDGVTELSAH